MIREVGPEEWRVWRDNRLRALEDAPDAFGRTLSEERAFDDELWQTRVASSEVAQFVADANGEIVGIAAATIDPEDASVAWIFSMWIAPNARRRGIARALLDTTTVWARDHGARTAELTVTENNNGAIELYRGYGFTDTDRREPLREGSALQTTWMSRSL